MKGTTLSASRCWVTHINIYRQEPEQLFVENDKKNIIVQSPDMDITNRSKNSKTLQDSKIHSGFFFFFFCKIHP
jgi:hypothetical protein